MINEPMTIIAATTLVGLVAAFISYATRPIAPQVPASPLDEAERILVNRYARGLISLEEYERMTALLRR